VVINLIVLTVTLLMLGFVSVWVFAPHLRSWFEEPKYRFLERERRFPEVERTNPSISRDAERSESVPRSAPRRG